MMSHFQVRNQLMRNPHILKMGVSAGLSKGLCVSISVVNRPPLQGVWAATTAVALGKRDSGGLCVTCWFPGQPRPCHCQKLPQTGKEYTDVCAQCAVVRNENDTGAPNLSPLPTPLLPEPKLHRLQASTSCR